MYPSNGGVPTETHNSTIFASNTFQFVLSDKFLDIPIKFQPPVDAENGNWAALDKEQKFPWLPKNFCRVA